MEAVYYAARANLQRLLRQHPRLLASPIGPGDRYVDMQRSLDTLHSLGDFCYLFKRSVAEQLGGFDAAYGAGPR